MKVIVQLKKMFFRFELFLFAILQCSTVIYCQNIQDSKVHNDLFGYDGECGEGPTTGVCKKITECFVAKGILIDKHHHGYDSCGYEGNVEIVCCPNIITIDLNSKERKSKIACSNYSNSLFLGIKDKILGGKNAKYGEFPHMAVLGYKYDYLDELQWECGASLISLNFVLTAAHCVDRADRLLPTTVRLGTVNKQGGEKIKPQDMSIKSITVNREYLPRIKRNDLALIQLEYEVTLNEYVYPACLHQSLIDPANLTVLGWGLTSLYGNSSDILQKAELVSVPTAECSAFYQARSGRPILPTQICAKSIDGKSDTCYGDSGGPLQIRKKGNNIDTIVGVTSYGIGCAEGRPGVYARVASYLNWIESIVWP